MDGEVEVRAVVDFWFAPGMAERWFVRSDAFDAECRERLQGAGEAAAVGRLDHWRDTPLGCLALCILLDQVPRNLYRDDSRAYAGDAAARAVTRHALAHGFDRALTQPQRLFLYLPLEHSEDPADQADSVALIGALDEHPEWLDYARGHRDVIERFGRFPHRNAPLGRETTPEEAAYLAQAEGPKARWW